MWLSPSLPRAILFLGLLFGGLHNVLADVFTQKRGGRLGQSPLWRQWQSAICWWRCTGWPRLAAFEATDVPEAVSRHCRNVAAQVLFTADERIIEELAICFFAHVAEHVGSRDPVTNIGQVFKNKVDLHADAKI